jgi:hypothetical protein
LKTNIIPIALLLTLFISLISEKGYAQQPDFSQVPGVVVAYSPASSGKYIGSPSICILPNGDYVASHDFFGPESNEHVKATSRVYTSADQGKSWRQISEVDGQFWSKLFAHQEALYFLGTDKHHGNMIIRRSTDGGKTWTEPTDEQNGLIRAGEYHCAPMPVIPYKNRLWRAMEYAKANTTKWGKRYSAFMMSIPIEADLLKADNWTASNKLPYDSTYLDGDFGGWIEGNAVITPEGGIIDLLRADNTKENAEDKAAIVHISEDGKEATFDPESGFVDFPGGSKKFTVRYDSASQRYWTISNYIPEEFKVEARPASIRNTQALCSSSDLTHWTVHTILLQHPDEEDHGFNYVDWQFEGKNLVFLSRTAYDDGVGGAANFHDANFLTFHRVKNFRKLSRKTLEKF